MPDRDQMKSCVERYVACHAAGDVDGIMALFADNATVWDPVGSDPHSGRDAVRAFFQGTHDMVDRLDMELTGPIRATADFAAFPMTATSHIGDFHLEIDIIDVMTFDDDAKIVEMRAYWDMKDARQV